MPGEKGVRTGKGCQGKGCQKRVSGTLFFEGRSAQVRVLRVLVQLFLARSREPAAGNEDIYKWRVDSTSPVPHSPFPATRAYPYAARQPTECATALQKPVRLGLEVWAGEPQRGDLTKPRPTAWVNGTQTDTRALKGRNNPFNPTRTARRRRFRARPAASGIPPES